MRKYKNHCEANFLNRHNCNTEWLESFDCLFLCD